MTKIEHGSVWRKWDLHYHSFNTHLNNQFKKNGISFDDYLESIEKSDIEAFGITDYWTVNDQINVINKFKEKYPNSTKKFFVNVEFRLNENVSNQSNGHVNAHLIFDDALDDETLINFINSLSLTELKSNGTCKKISELNSIEDFSKATISKEEITRKLKERFGSDTPYLKIFAANGLGGIHPHIDENYKGSLRNGPLSDEIDKLADFFFSDNQSRDYFLDKNCNRYEASKPKACVLASDYHGTNNQERLEKFSWIKADLTFAGLRQLKFEPEERVAIQTQRPDEKNDYHVIDHVTFNQKKR